MSATAAALKDFLQTLDNRSDDRYARIPERELIDVGSIVANSNGGQEYAVGTIDGKGEFVVKPGGRALAVGDRVLADRIGTDPLGNEYQLVDIIASNNPFAGILATDANIPFPVFAGTPFTSAIIPSGGAIHASMTVFWVQVEAKYAPTGYKVSWRLTGTSDWQDIHVPHRAGIANGQVLLSSSLLPGQQIDVKLATEANWLLRTSPEGPTQTFTCAADTNTPAVLATVTVSTATPGQLVVTPNASSINDTYFLDWEYTIATGPTGSGAVVLYARGPLTYAGTAGVDYYVAVRARSKNGTFGNRIPATAGTFLGPFVFAVATPPPDTTPPPAFTLPPVLTNISYTDDQYVTHGVVRIQLPVYSFPPDYLGTEILASSWEGRSWAGFINGTTTTFDVEIGFSQLWTISVRGVDVVGNRQPTFGPTATVPVPMPGIPATPGSAPVITQRALALWVTWVMPAGSTASELWRADDLAFTTNVRNLGFINGSSYLDLEDGLTGAPPYPVRYYRVRGINNIGPGGWSPVSLPVSVLKLDGRNIVADTITATEIAAGTITGTELNATIVLASIIRTPNQASGWVSMEGNGTNSAFSAYNNAGVLQMRLVGNALTYYRDGTNPRAQFTSTGFSVFNDAGAARVTMTANSLTFFGDSAQQDIVMGVASGRGYLASGGFKVGSDILQMDLAFAYSASAGVRLFDSANSNCDIRVRSVLAIDGTTPVIAFIGDQSSSTRRGLAVGMGSGFYGGMDGGYLYFIGDRLTAGANAGPDRGFIRSGVFGGASSGSWSITSGGTIVGLVGLQCGDIVTHRANNTGVHYFGNSLSQYLYYDGSNWTLAGGGTITVNGLTTGGTIYTSTVHRAGVNSTSGASYNAWNGDLAASAGAVSGPHLTSVTGTGGNNLYLDILSYRFQGTSSWPGTVSMLRSNVDGGGFWGGAMMLGSTSGSAAFWGMFIGGGATLQLYWSGLNNRIEAATNFNVQGTLTKTAGSFRIPHPDPSKKGVDLRHSFVESPTRGDNIYRFRASVKKAHAVDERYQREYDLPDYFEYLNEPGEGGAWPVRHFGRAFVDVDPAGKTFTLVADAPGDYLVFIVATRKDEAAIRNWDDDGGIEPRAMFTMEEQGFTNLPIPGASEAA